MTTPAGTGFWVGFNSDWRKNFNPAFKAPHLTRNLVFVESLRRIAERLGRSPAEVAIAWTLRHPVVTGPIVGARDPAQEASTNASPVSLTVIPAF